MSKGPTVAEYQALGYRKLHGELKKMIAQAQRMTVWFNADKRLRLLPALAAMKRLVAQPGRRCEVKGQPNWEEECRLLGLTAEQVRQWKKRTASETDIRAMLGEENGRRPRSASPPTTQDLHHFMLLVQTVMDGDYDKAERLAHVYAEIYGF